MLVIPRFVLHLLFIFCYLPVVISPGTRQVLTRKHFNAALAAHEEGRLQQAAREYSAAAFYGGTSPEILNNSGTVFLELGSYDKALEVLIQAKRQAPSMLAVRVNLGLVYYELARWESLRKESQEILAMGIEEGWAYFGQGVALYHLGEYKSAYRSLKLSLHKKTPVEYDFSSEARRLLRKIELLSGGTGRFR